MPFDTISLLGDSLQLPQSLNAAAHARSVLCHHEGSKPVAQGNLGVYWGSYSRVSPSQCDRRNPTLLVHTGHLSHEAPNGKQPYNNHKSPFIVSNSCRIVASRDASVCPLRIISHFASAMLQIRTVQSVEPDASLEGAAIVLI